MRATLSCMSGKEKGRQKRIFKKRRLTRARIQVVLHTSRACSSHARAGGPLEPSMLEHTSPLGSSMLEHNRVIPCTISRDLVDSNYINPASFSLLSPFLFHLPSQSPPESQNLHIHHAHLSSTITKSASCLSKVENSQAYPRIISKKLFVVL